MDMEDLRTLTLTAALAVVSETKGSDNPASNKLWTAIAALHHADANRAEAHKLFQGWLEVNPFAATVNEVDPWNGYPDGPGPSLNAFLYWCSEVRHPEKTKAWSGTAFLIDDDRRHRYVALLGQLVGEHGRDCVDAAVDVYGEWRQITDLMSRLHGQAWGAFNDAADAFFSAEPAACCLISMGLVLWNLLERIEAQKEDGYWIAQGDRAEAGYHSPPPATIDEVRSWIAVKVRHASGAVDTLQEMLDNLGLLKLPRHEGGVVSLANAVFQARYPSVEPWWIGGFRQAITVFGPGATLGGIADGTELAVGEVA